MCGGGSVCDFGPAMGMRLSIITSYPLRLVGRIHGDGLGHDLHIWWW